MFKWFLKNEKLNSKIRLSNNSSFVILIFAILKFRNIGRSTCHRFKFWPPPIYINFQTFIFYSVLYDVAKTHSRFKMYNENRVYHIIGIMGRREKVIINWNFGKYKVEGKVRLDWQYRESAAIGRSKEDEGGRPIE